jgi:filamin
MVMNITTLYCSVCAVDKIIFPGGLALAVEGPSKAEMDISDNGDDTCSVSYLPTEPGKYTINIKFADIHIQGSPFTVKILPAGL